MTACYLTIASYGFLGGGAYGSLPDAAIWWCLRTGGGGVLTSRWRWKNKIMTFCQWVTYAGGVSHLQQHPSCRCN